MKNSEKNKEIKKRNKKIDASNFGRAFGWTLELDGKPVIYLSRYLNEDMFWDSYRIIAINDDELFNNRILTTKFWDKEVWNCKPVFRNNELGEVAKNACNGPLIENGRILMRGLYLKKEKVIRHPFVNFFIYVWNKL